MPKSLLIFGYGYLAHHLSSLLPKKNWKIFATSRQTNIIRKEDNITIIPYSDFHKILPEITHIIVTIPPNEQGDIVLQDLNRTKNPPYLQFPSLRWVGYCSSTSVYGDHNGTIVDEQTPTNPACSKGKNRLLAEQEWQEFAKQHGIHLNIFRLSGIYGPGRNAVERVAKKETTYSVIKEGHKFSRIHVKDIAGIFLSAIEKNLPYDIFNLADDLPCSSEQINNYAADLLALPHLPTINWQDEKISASLKGFFLSNKIISNKKIKNRLGYKLKYPSYKEGLEDIIFKKSAEK